MLKESKLQTRNDEYLAEPPHAGLINPVQPDARGAEPIEAGQTSGVSLAANVTRSDSVVQSSSPQEETDSNPVPSDIESDIIAIVRTWNQAKDNHDANALDAIYADRIEFYGMNLSKKRVFADTVFFFDQNPSFAQRINGDIRVLEQNSGVYVAEFTKDVSTGDSVKSFEAYLVLSDPHDEGRLFIITEGDKITDRNLARRKKSHSAQN